MKKKLTKISQKQYTHHQRNTAHRNNIKKSFHSYKLHNHLQLIVFLLKNTELDSKYCNTLKKNLPQLVAHCLHLHPHLHQPHQRHCLQWPFELQPLPYL